MSESEAWLEAKCENARFQKIISDIESDIETEKATDKNIKHWVTRTSPARAFTYQPVLLFRFFDRRLARYCAKPDYAQHIRTALQIARHPTQWCWQNVGCLHVARDGSTKHKNRYNWTIRIESMESNILTRLYSKDQIHSTGIETQHDIICDTHLT